MECRHQHARRHYEGRVEIYCTVCRKVICVKHRHEFDAEDVLEAFWLGFIAGLEHCPRPRVFRFNTMKFNPNPQTPQVLNIEDWGPDGSAFVQNVPFDSYTVTMDPAVGSVDPATGVFTPVPGAPAGTSGAVSATGTWDDSPISLNDTATLGVDQFRFKVN